MGREGRVLALAACLLAGTGPARAGEEGRLPAPKEASGPPPAKPAWDPVAGLPPLRELPDTRGEGDVAEAALDWLARHQSPGGGWDGDGFSATCKGGICPGPGGGAFDAGVTGLALLAFLGCGETHKTERYGTVVRNGLRYLKGIQDSEGCFGPRASNHFTHNHAIATLAMAEAYGLTQSPLFQTSAQDGIQFAERCRNPGLAWRYGMRPQDNDTSVTGWMVMALKSAKSGGLAVDEEAFRGALAWLDRVTDPEYGRAGYTARGNGPCRMKGMVDRFPASQSETLTAEAVFARILCGAARDDPMVAKGIDLCRRVLPRWDPEAGSIDYHYWYFGTLVTFQVGKDVWREEWKPALRKALWTHQRGDSDGCARGSWDPVDPWGPDGGRVCSTALGAMMTEAWFRYVPVAGRK